MKEFLTSLLDRDKKEGGNNKLVEKEILVTLEQVKQNPVVDTYLSATDRHMSYLGYTEHGRRHANLVSNISHNILRRLGRSERDAELAAIAGYLHDIGSLINRHHHAKTGAVLAHSILSEMGMAPAEIAEVIAAIGNHDESHFDPVSGIAAAVVLADKSDVHRSRVRSSELSMFSPLDRVNYAVENSFLRVDHENKIITLELSIDTDISQVMSYFELFLKRMLISQKAATFLNCKFSLEINGSKLL